MKKPTKFVLEALKSKEYKKNALKPLQHTTVCLAKSEQNKAVIRDEKAKALNLKMTTLSRLS